MSEYTNIISDGGLDPRNALDAPTVKDFATTLEPVAWMSPQKERLEFSRIDTVYGSHTIPLVHQSDAAAIIAAKDAEIERLKSQLISIAYVDEVPQVQQGEPNHEVLELLEAETVRGFITTIERLTRERELITQAVRWAPSSAYWSNVLRDLCGLEARDGINHLESQAREYREQLAAALAKAWALSGGQE